MSKPRILMILILLHLAPASVQAATHDWTWWARRLTLSTTAKNESVAQLRSYPKIELRLREALETKDRFLAFDAIAALKRRSLLDALVASASTDDSGYCYLAISSLMESGDAEKFAPVFRARLKQAATSGPARIVILDTLSRMSERLPSDQLRDLLSDSLPELQHAALSYLRAFILDGPDPEYMGVFKQLLLSHDLTGSMRLQALYLVSELSTTQLIALGQIKGACAKTYPEKLQNVCRRMARE